jgi:hypothetical protein
MRPSGSTAAAALGVALALAMTAGARAADDPESRYQALVAAAKAGDKTVDWQALRFAFVDRPVYTGAPDYEEQAQADKMRQAFRAGDFKGAVAAAKAIEDVDFVDEEPHLVASQAYEKLGDQLNADRERVIALGLLQSMKTGDGSSAGRALTAISSKEEYVLMASDGRRIVSKTPQMIDGHAYDVVETVDRAGAPVTFYILVDRVMATATHVLRLPDKK